ncbi:HNT3 [Candida theae]|uniref:HNT3 n=1 Tax=Candida theae TaxID=1198502 RepID=A0AAD5FWF0_9ASCO|nr:HNT3 [Candida theae]KAI5948838.1 HNT3 [Candida theae]
MAFIVELWESIFTPGTTPALIKATHASFILLLASLATLIYLTKSIHFVNLLVIAVLLYGTVVWFINELQQVKLKDNEELNAKKGEEVTGKQSVMSFANAFQKIIDQPKKFDSVLFQDENVVIIKDMYPKSIRHLLVIPRHPDVTHKHPLDVFNTNYKEHTGEELYDMVGEYVEKAKDLIANNLAAKLGIAEAAEIQELRNKFIKAGVHSIPSLNNLHIHVMTQDFHSPRLKNKKHYNSFTTEFFVNFESLNPLYNEAYNRLNNRYDNGFDSGSEASSTSSQDDDQPEFVKHTRSVAVLEDIIKSTPLKCSICSKTFANSMVRLKEHLSEEFKIKFEALGNPEKITINDF